MRRDRDNHCDLGSDRAYVELGSLLSADASERILGSTFGHIQHPTHLAETLYLDTPAPMSTPRTYSRRNSKRRRLDSSYPSSESSEEDSSGPQPSLTQRKRPKVQVEVVPPLSSSSEVQHISHDATNIRESKQPHDRRLRLSRSSTPGSSAKHPIARAASEQSFPSSSRSTRASAPPIRSASKSKVKPSSSDTTVKDLSDLFDFQQPSSSKPSGLKALKTYPGVAKRMLRRTNTDSAIGTSTGIDDVATSSTQPRPLQSERTELIIQDGLQSGSGSTPLTPSHSGSLEENNAPPIRPALPATTSMRTYGGKSRSFLVAIPSAGGTLASLNGGGSQTPGDPHGFNDPAEDDSEVRESYKDLIARWGVEDEEVYPTYPNNSPGSKQKGKGKIFPPPAPLPPNMMNDLKSISELRSKGEVRRFLDDMGYLFEGLDPQVAVNVRRGSAMEIVTKLCDPDFVRQAKAADFFSRAWEALREAGGGEGDKVLDTILVFFAALVAKDPLDLADLASKSDFVAVMYDLLGSLDRESDSMWLISSGLSDIELKRVGISKQEKSSLASLHHMVQEKSGLFETTDMISNRLMVSQALAALSPALQSPIHLPVLISSLLSELKPIPSRISTYVAGLSLLPTLASSSHQDVPTIQHIEYCVRLVDQYLLNRWADSPADFTFDLRNQTAEKIRQLSDGLVSVCVASDIILRDVEMKDYHEAAQKCLESASRVLINLTDDNTTWCQALLDNPLTLSAIVRVVTSSQRQRAAALKRNDSTDGEGEDAAQLLDRLCLALGLLTNLVQVVHQTADSIRELTFDYECPGKRNCILECRCPSRTSALESLATVYNEQCKSTSEVEVIVRGHIAVLFGLLMRHSKENQQILLASLPGSSNKKKLHALAESAREFMLFYVEFAKKVSVVANEDEDGDDALADGGERVEQGGVGSLIRDTQGETVARSVTEFLEDLRNSTRN